MPLRRSDWEQRLDDRLRRRWSSHLMNDTKWREIWLILAELRTRIHFAYADAEEWNEYNASKLWGPFYTEQVWERGVHDPGIGGPFLFKQILRIRVPASVTPVDLRHPVVRNDLDALRQRLHGLGQLPLTERDDSVEIHGYA